MNNLLEIPDWCTKPETKKLKQLVMKLGQAINLTAIGFSIDFPEWKYLTFTQRQDLTTRGFIPDVDKMGNPRIKVSQEARVQLLRNKVMSKRNGKA